MSLATLGNRLKRNKQAFSALKIETLCMKMLPIFKVCEERLMSSLSVSRQYGSRDRSHSGIKVGIKIPDFFTRLPPKDDRKIESPH